MDKYAYPAITNAAFKMNGLSRLQEEQVRNEYCAKSREELFLYASERKILPFVAYLISALHLDDDYWTPIVEAYRKRNVNIVEQLNIVFQSFDRHDVKKVFASQNFGAMLAGGKDICLFASGDVDICGSIEEKEAIHRAFLELGYIGKDRYCGKRLLSTEYSNEAVLTDNFAFVIEFDTLSRLKLPNPIDMETFVDWDSLWKYKDTAILLPSKEALLYICLVHISLHSFSRAPDIRLYIDIENCIQNNPDWETVLRIASRDKTAIRVLTVALITSKLFSLDLNIAVQRFALANQKKIARLMNMVYNAKKNELIYEPSKLKTLEIELNYYDKKNGIVEALFPSVKWMDEVYGSNGLFAHLEHFLWILK